MSETDKALSGAFVPQYLEDSDASTGICSVMSRAKRLAVTI